MYSQEPTDAPFTPRPQNGRIEEGRTGDGLSYDGTGLCATCEAFMQATTHAISHEKRYLFRLKDYKSSLETEEEVSRTRDAISHTQERVDSLLRALRTFKREADLRPAKFPPSAFQPHEDDEQG